MCAVIYRHFFIYAFMLYAFLNVKFKKFIFSYNIDDVFLCGEINDSNQILPHQRRTQNCISLTFLH